VTDSVSIARGLLGAADVGDGPTPEQQNLLQSILHGYLGADVDAATLDALSPAELAAAVDEADRARVVDLLVVVEFCRHTDTAAQADRVEAYATALGFDSPFLAVARDALVAGTEQVMTDWSRFREPSSREPSVGDDADPALAARLRDLANCPPGSLGRAYFDFYDRWGLSFPGEEGGGDVTLVAHDFSHVLAGYDTDAPSEVALQAMLTSATGFAHHFSGLVASLALFESGKFDILEITPRVAALDRPGAAALVADAFRRGTTCTRDFSTIDHLARASELVDAVRADCGITPRAA
jgi:hypothetical protein